MLPPDGRFCGDAPLFGVALLLFVPSPLLLALSPVLDPPRLLEALCKDCMAAYAVICSNNTAATALA